MCAGWGSRPRTGSSYARGEVEEALRAKKETVRRPVRRADQAQVVEQIGMTPRRRREPERGRPALGIEAPLDGDGLDQRRLPRPVLADEVRHRPRELDRLQPAHGRQIERIL